MCVDEVGLKMQGNPSELNLSLTFSPPLTVHRYCKVTESLSSLSSSCRVGVGARRLLLRKLRAGREALVGGGPRKEEEAAEGSGATVALTLLWDSSWRFWS